MSGTFSRGAQAMNSMFFKPALRKGFHKKSSADPVLNVAKLEGEDAKSKSRAGGSDGGYWVPHKRTGIYCPKGQEKVIEDISPGAAKDAGVNWISYNEDDLV